MAKQNQAYIRLLLKGPSSLADDLAHIREDLKLRNWEDLKITWDHTLNGLVVETRFSGSKVDLIAKHFQEELFEAASGILESVEGMHVKILDASLLNYE